MNFFIRIICLFIYCTVIATDTSKGQGQGHKCKSIAECEAEARAYLEGEYEQQASSFCNKAALANFNYETNLDSEDAEREKDETSTAESNFKFKAWNERIRHWDYESFTDEKLKRQLKFLNVIDEAALNATDLKRHNHIKKEIAKRYDTAKICPFHNQKCNLTTEGLKLQPDIQDVMAESRNSEELAYIWKAWHDATGKPIRNLYSEFVDLRNKAAKVNGFNDTGELWLNRYESKDIKQRAAKIWNDVKDLYKKLYGYVRYHLRQKYPQYFKRDDDPIPAHLLGNMWGQSWSHIYDLVKPFPNAPQFDVTTALKKRFGPDGLESVTEVFKLANKFFMDLGLEDMSMAFGEKAVIVRPKDREVICHASANEFCDGKDFRIKMCTKINQQHFITVHHELGHIQYFIQYKNLPISFRTGANPGFHEAIGDVLALSVETTKHMIKLGLQNETENHNPEPTINFLMKAALDKVAFLPFGYAIDSFRWQLFDGSIPRAKMTENWLKIRNEMQGLIPPVNRTEQDFDPGAKFHVPSNVPYIRYFISGILQFQLHRTLCIAAGEFVEGDPEKPLHNCDIDGNAAAGAIFKELLQAGASTHWENTLEKATGNRQVDASAIKEYFAPLIQYLDEQQARLNYSITWRNDAWKDRYSGD